MEQNKTEFQKFLQTSNAENYARAMAQSITIISQNIIEGTARLKKEIEGMKKGNLKATQRARKLTLILNKIYKSFREGSIKTFKAIRENKPKGFFAGKQLKIRTKIVSIDPLKVMHMHKEILDGKS